MDSRTFATIFDCIDNLTAPMQKILGMRDKIAEKPKLAIEVAVSSTGLDKLQSSAWRGTALANGMNTSLKETGNVAENAGKKGESGLARMEGKFKGLTGAAGDFQGALGAIVGLGLSGTIGGITWAAADASENIMATSTAVLAKKKFDIEKARVSIAAMTATGLTTNNEQMSLLTTLSNKGMKPDKAINAAEKVTLGFMNSKDYMQSNGISNAESALERLTTNAKIRPNSNYAKEMDALAITMGYDKNKKFSTLSAKQRQKAIEKFQLYKTDENGDTMLDDKGEKIKLTDQDIREKNMETVVSNRISSLTKSVGKTMLGPADTLLGVLEKIINFVQVVPGMPGLIAIGAILVGLASAGTAVTAVLPIFNARLMLMGVRSATAAATTTGLAAAQTGAAVSSRAMAVAGFGGVAATTAGTVATVANTSATNVSVVSKLRLAASHGMATASLWAHSVATAASSAAHWVYAAATGAASGATLMTIPALGAMTAATAAATTATGALAAAEGVAAAPLWPFIIVGLAVVAVLGYLAAKSGVLSAVLKGLGKIDLGKVWKDLSRGDLGKAWHDLTKGFKLPSLKQMMANLKLPDIQAGLSFLGEEGNELLGFVVALLKKAVSFLDWLWQSIKSGFQWIKDGLGLTKASKEAKVTEQAKKEGLVWVEKMGDNPAQWYKDGSAVGVDAGSNKLKKLQLDAQNAPDSAFGKIGEYIAKGLGNVGEEIGKKLSEYMNPVLDPLTNAINALAKYLGIGDDDEKPPEPMYRTGADGKTYQGSTEVVNKKDGAGNTYWTFVPPATPAAPATTTAPSSNFNQIGKASVSLNIPQLPGVSYDYGKSSENAKSILGFDVGATFKRGGRLTADVHEREEIIPRAVAVRGPGPISRALDDLGKRDSSITKESQIVNHYHTYKIDASQHIGKVETEMDVTRMNRITIASLDDIFNRKARQAGN